MKTVLITGGAGFIGSHLAQDLVARGEKVVVVDNFLTGNRDNLSQVIESENLTLIEADVAEPPEQYLPRDLEIDEIYHLASPASPRGYQENPVATYKVNAFGTHYLAELAKKTGAVFLYASTSEVYGDPLEHPQKESYWGNVHIRGVRSCYDESKRFGEMVQTVWQREHGVNIRTVRIFNTYGPRMDPRDGRVFPNFISQALKDEPITVYGDGEQTRSFCYVSDLVAGLIQVMESPNAQGEVYNLGNPKEQSMLDVAKLIRKLTGSNSEMVFEPLPEDDPSRRRPDIDKIKSELGWEPKVDLETGLKETIEYFRDKLGIRK